MRTRARRLVRLLGYLMIVAGLSMLLYLVGTDAYGYVQQRRLEAEWRRLVRYESQVNDRTPGDEGPSSTTTSTAGTEKPVPTTTSRPNVPPKIADRKIVARIVIPKIGLDSIVVHGVTPEALKLGPGHMEETPLPGSRGNSVISGHRVTFKRPFFYLDLLEPGDPIIIYTTTAKYTYRVAEEKVVKPTDVSVIRPTDDTRLTLTTCNPRFSARTRLIIVAKLSTSRSQITQ